MNEDTKISCDSCGADSADTEIAIIEGSSVCQDCSLVCDHCGSLMYQDWSPVDGGDQHFCESCISDYAYWCEGCDEWNTYGTGRILDRNESWCEGCLNDAYFCENCDGYYADGCDNCSEREPETIHDYSYRPDPIFHATQADGENHRLYFGIELEMEAPRGDFTSRNLAAEYAARLEEYDLAYLKSDGSLNCGMELVTHPMSHHFYQSEAQELWDTLDKLRSDTYGMRAWGTGSCGYHIHISRAGFGSGSHLHRFLSLVYSNQEFFEKMAGRSSDRWAKFDDVLRPKAVDDGEGNRRWVMERSYKDKIDSGRHTERYSAVNTQNRHTVEMRIFRGTIKTDTVKAQISLAHASVEYTRRLTVRDVNAGALTAENLTEYIALNSEMYPELQERINRLITASV